MQTDRAPTLRLTHREDDFADDILEDKDDERDARRKIGVHRADINTGTRARAEEQIARLLTKATLIPKRCV